MGYQTRARVGLIPPGDLTVRQRLVLQAMASTCRDREENGQPAGIYFRGWRYLARVLDYPEYTEPAKHAVRRVIRELVDAKRIEPVGWVNEHGSRAYRLILPPD